MMMITPLLTETNAGLLLAYTKASGWPTLQGSITMSGFDHGPNKAEVSGFENFTWYWWRGIHHWSIIQNSPLPQRKWSSNNLHTPSTPDDKKKLFSYFMEYKHTSFPWNIAGSLRAETTLYPSTFGEKLTQWNQNFKTSKQHALLLDSWMVR